MHIDITCDEDRRQITTSDIRSEDMAITPVRESPNDAGVPVTVLTKGQRFAVKLKAAKGTGREHAKWIPCGPISWEYDDVPSTDEDTSTRMGVELNGSLSGTDILESACRILQDKLLRMARDASKMEI
jgi:DNA-directed RNA polymerase alpha subunit